LAQWQSERLGQQFVIENRSGAATNIATETAIRSPADGYTLLMANSTNTINASLYERLNFDLSETRYRSRALWILRTSWWSIHRLSLNPRLNSSPTIGGQVQVYFATINGSIKHIRAGKLRALAVTSATRSDSLMSHMGQARPCRASRRCGGFTPGNSTMILQAFVKSRFLR
jgi:hypothetical protein